MQTGVTLVDRLNVRSEPSKSSTSLGKLNKNTMVTVYRIENEWVEIDFQGSHGWVAESYIELGKNKSETKINKAYGHCKSNRFWFKCAEKGLS